MTPPDGEETPALLARLPGVRALDLEVLAAPMLTPTTRRVRLGGEGLADLDAEPGQDLMVAVPAEGRPHLRRRYTIRHLDRDHAAVDLDIVLHGHAPGTRWAAALRPGDRVEAIGPRGKIRLDDQARWHLFFGDESAVPAVFSMIEAIGPDVVAVALLEVGGPEEEQAPDDVRCDLDLRWIHRHGPPGTSRQMAEAAGEVRMPAGRGHCYVFGELHEVAAARAALVGRGIEPKQIAHKGYWRLGEANAAHGEPRRPEAD